MKTLTEFDGFFLRDIAEIKKTIFPQKAPIKKNNNKKNFSKTENLSEKPEDEKSSETLVEQAQETPDPNLETAAGSVSEKPVSETVPPILTEEDLWSNLKSKVLELQKVDESKIDYLMESLKAIQWRFRDLRRAVVYSLSEEELKKPAEGLILFGERAVKLEFLTPLKPKNFDKKGKGKFAKGDKKRKKRGSGDRKNQKNSPEQKNFNNKNKKDTRKPKEFVPMTITLKPKNSEQVNGSN